MMFLSDVNIAKVRATDCIWSTGESHPAAGPDPTVSRCSIDSGWAILEDDELSGMFTFFQGDESRFTAEQNKT